ncbi:hypothetical protein GCM10025794_30970 [Massilia kyonggiensis]
MRLADSPESQLIVVAAFNGVGVPLKSLPHDERYRIQFVCPS